DGTFALAPFSFSTYSATFAAADLDTDGNVDVVAISNYPFFLSVWFGRGDGTFGEPVSLDPTSDLSGFTGTIVVADLDNDERPDVAVNYGFSVGVFLNHGDRTFLALPRFQSGGATDLMTGDFNEDARRDLLVVDPYMTSGLNGLNGTVEVLPNPGPLPD